MSGKPSSLHGAFGDVFCSRGHWFVLGSGVFERLKTFGGLPGLKSYMFRLNSKKGGCLHPKN